MMDTKEALKELEDLTVDYGNRNEEQIARLDEAIDMAMEALRNLPNRLRQAMDTISRQAAVEACYNGWNKDYRGIAQDIKDLPSAQPERTCVNCGRTVNNGGWYADGGTRCPIEEHYALPKDGYCHLWEKRNVTDDDYPERREK